MGEMGRGMWEVRWRRDLERACSTGFWEGKYGELKEVQEEKEVRECGTRHKQNNIEDT